MATAICRPWGQELPFACTFSLSVLFLCSSSLTLPLFFTSFSSSLYSSARFLSISCSVFLSVHLCFPFSLPRVHSFSVFSTVFLSHPSFFVFVSAKNKKRMNLLSLSCFAVTVSLKSKIKRWDIFLWPPLEGEQASTAGDVNP